MLASATDANRAYHPAGITLTQTTDRRRRPDDRLQGMRQRKCPDLLPLSNPVVHGEAEMNAGVNPRLPVLISRLGETRKRTGDTGKRYTAGSGERHIVVMEEPT